MSTIFGLKPFPLHQDMFTADMCVLETWSTDKQKYIDRWNSYTTPFALTLRHGIGATPQPFYTSHREYKNQLQEIGGLPLVNKPVFYSIENECLEKTHHSEGVEKYCTELHLAKRFLPHDIRFTNGGFTLPHIYWYAYVTGDKRLTVGRSLDNLTALIDEAEYEMDYIAGLPERFICNAHIYLYDINLVSAYIDYLNFIKSYTGKEILSNECGIYVEDIELLKGLVSIARATEMSYMIFFSGDGSSNAKPITVEQIKAAIQ